MKAALVSAATLPARYVLLDGSLPGLRHISDLRQVLRVLPNARLVLVVEGYSIAAAVRALKMGVHSVIERPAALPRIVDELLRQGALGLRAPPPSDLTLERALWEHAQRVYVDAGGNVSETARRLDVQRRTLLRILSWSPAEPLSP